MLEFANKLKHSDLVAEIRKRQGGNIAHYNDVYIYRNTLVKEYIERLVTYADKLGIKTIVGKNGKIGKRTELGRLKINIRKYVLEFGPAEFCHEDIERIGIQGGNLLVIETTEGLEIAFKLI